jgi:hypothetical protein
MKYLRDHWRGLHGLSRAFWINTVLPIVLIALVEPTIRPTPNESSIAGALLALVYVMVGHGLVLTWQLVGLWRTCRRHLEQRGDLLNVTFAQAAGVVALIAAFGSTTSTIDAVFGLSTREDVTVDPPPYRLEVARGGEAILIEGPFEIGLSRDLKALLAKTPSVERLILKSNGGRIFEARGIAGQILEKDLDTEVVDVCRSACTIAFIAGDKRMIGAAAKLGFHSYKLEATMAFIDPLEEQEKDKAFFLEQGIERDFVDQIYSTPHEVMWHPDAARLLSAGVVHGVWSDR